ncbi:hypothetical protein [Roseivirga sp.]|uniref:hypothetical protein n=1 Tax=Roseivirga sp. TaxID=1964215 RepID=UPI003B52B6C9
MRKVLAIIPVLVLAMACQKQPEPLQLEQVTGELESKLDVNWTDLPTNQDITTTSPVGGEHFAPISTEDFGVNSETLVYDPAVTGLYYDVQNLTGLSEIGQLEMTISVVSTNGFIERLTTVTLNNVENTTENNGARSKIPIFTADDTGDVNLNALVAMNQSIILGRIVFQIDLVGRNVHLKNPEDFDIVFSYDLQGNIEQ